MFHAQGVTEVYLNQQFSEMEPLNRDRLAQVLEICSDLEDLIRDTAGKRKKYPQQIEEGVNQILQRRKEMLVSGLYIDYLKVKSLLSQVSVSA